MRYCLSNLKFKEKGSIPCERVPFIWDYDELKNSKRKETLRLEGVRFIRILGSDESKELTEGKKTKE